MTIRNGLAKVLSAGAVGWAYSELAPKIVTPLANSISDVAAEAAQPIVGEFILDKGPEFLGYATLFAATAYVYQNITRALGGRA